MEKRGIARSTAVLLLILLIIIIISLFIIFRKPKLEPYSENPEDWVEDIGDGVKELSVEEATFGQGYADNIGQQLRVGEINTIFGFDGWYKDTYFTWLYMEEDVVMIAINSNMKPGDDVIEGYIVSNLVNDEIKVNIFVDEDWKIKIGEKTNIIWGKDYTNIKKFTFTEISDGIYMDTITDDRARFSEDFKIRDGGIIVGDITLDNINSENFDNVIYIRQY